MSGEKEQSFSIHGGTFVGAHSWGAHSTARVEQVNYGNDHQADLDELRRLVERLAEELRTATESDPADEARWRAEELSELLQEEQPNPEHVKTRWSRLKPRIPATLAGAGAVAEIAGLVQSLV